MKLTTCVLLLSQLAPAIATPAWADDATTDLSAKRLSVQTITAALLQKQVLPSRSICQESGGGTGPGHCPKITVPKPVSLDQITFEFNSAQLTPGARAVLDMIGAALSGQQLSDRSFEVEGHTDAKGNEDYNLALSKRRAESVKRYLTTVARIDSDRLEIVAMGELDLLYPNDPENAKSRRVVFRGIE